MAELATLIRGAGVAQALEETLKALAVPALRERLMALGLNVNVANPPTPEQMWASIAADHKSVGEMLRSVNYKPE